MSELQIHPAAELFPMMSDVEYQGLKESIREYGGNCEPIMFWCGQLIDGRNRLRACQELGIEPWQNELDEEFDPWQYVINHNLHRRHLSESQRAMVASKLAKLKHGGDRKSEEIKGSIDPSITEAAETLNVSTASVKRAKTVLRDGSEELQQAVERGEVAVSKAATIAKTTPKEQQLQAATKKPEKKPKPTKKAPAKPEPQRKLEPEPQPKQDNQRSILQAIDHLYDVLRSELGTMPDGSLGLAAEAAVDVFGEYGVEMKLIQ